MDSERVALSTASLREKYDIYFNTNPNLKLGQTCFESFLETGCSLIVSSYLYSDSHRDPFRERDLNPPCILFHHRGKRNIFSRSSRNRTYIFRFGGGCLAIETMLPLLLFNLKSWYKHGSNYPADFSALIASQQTILFL